MAKKQASKTRYMAMILYPHENEYHAQIMEYVDRMYEYCYIVHNQDKNEDGTPKKEHVHVVIHYPNPRTASGVAKEFSYDEEHKVHHVEEISDVTQYLKYLLHDTFQARQQGKHLYSIDELIGSFDLIKKIGNSTENDETRVSVKIILDIIEQENIRTYKQLIHRLVNEGNGDLLAYAINKAYAISQIIKG